MEATIVKKVPKPVPVEYTLTLKLNEYERTSLLNILRWGLQRKPSLADSGINVEQQVLLTSIYDELNKR